MNKPKLLPILESRAVTGRATPKGLQSKLLPFPDASWYYGQDTGKSHGQYQESANKLLCVQQGFSIRYVFKPKNSKFLSSLSCKSRLGLICHFPPLLPDSQG